MTRLREEDLEPIARQILGYDARLKQKTGASLRQIASRAAGLDEGMILELLDRICIAAVPVTTGLGVIGGFSEAVVSIVSHLGFEAFVTESGDLAGITEGTERGANLLMLADDFRFVALTPEGEEVADNDRATALGFVVGLELMSGGLAGESVLGLGCGPVGESAAKALIEGGAQVSLYDIEEHRAQTALRRIARDTPDRVRMEGSASSTLQGYQLIFDATNEGNFIEPRHLTPHTLVAAPGMPCALTQDAMAKHGDRVLHDALEIGTATMAVQAAAVLARGVGDAGEPIQ